ncbi:MAG: glycosyl hydrolase family 28-related protein [Planctomycetota bacterium]
MLATLLLLAGSAAQADLSVVAFGAVPDDGLDDSVAIQSTLDAACSQGLGVLFPAGTYDIGTDNLASVLPGDPLVLLRLPCEGLRLRGEGASRSVLRVMDGVGAYESVLAAPRFADSVSGLILEDLAMDGNSAENPVTGDADLDDILRERRHALRVYVGQRISVRRCRFTAWRNVNVLTFNGVDVADVAVVGCEFDGIGAPPPPAPGTVGDWDHSSIYTDCDGAWLVDNRFESVDGPGTFGVRAAIETHGPRQFVLGNEVVAFTSGMNATGISVLGSAGQWIARNRFLDVSDGIRIWSWTVPGGPPGETLSGLSITGNCIRIDADGWRGTQDPFGQAPKGISLEGRSDGGLRDVVIEANDIRFLPAATARAWDRDAFGIELFAEAFPTAPASDVRIERNRIRGALSSGIYVGGTLERWTVRANRIEGAGAGAGVPAGLRSAFVVFGSYAQMGFRENCVEDRASRLAQVYYLFDDNRGRCLIQDDGWIRAASSSAPYVRSDATLSARWTVGAPAPDCPSSPPSLGPLVRPFCGG